MKNPSRVLVGCAALAAGLWLVTGPAPAGTPDLPADSYKKAAAADVKFLQERLDELAKADTPLTRSAKPATAVALLVAAYADALGDPALKDGAIKVGEAIEAKNYKEASALANKLAVKPGGGKAGGDLPKLPFYEAKKDKSSFYLSTTMKVFSNTKVLNIPAGLNIEKDLKEWTARGSTAKLDPAEVELLAVRSAVVNEYALHNPTEKAANNPKNLKEWQDLAKQSVDLSKQIAAEAGKKGANPKELRKQLTLLEAACTNCHGKYRYDD